MAARIKLGLDMSICMTMTITITQAIKVTSINKFKINTALPFKRNLPFSLYGERGFVNPTNPLVCCLARDRVVYGLALVQPWCNKTGKHHKVVVLTAELAENC